MLKDPIRIAPQWKDLKCQLVEKLELQKGLPEAAEAGYILLSDRPSIIFRASCFPSLMPPICFYATSASSYFASFTWKSTKGNKNMVRVWLYSTEDDALVTEKDYVTEEDPRVLTIVYVPCRHLFVTYCDDLHFRLFSDPQEGVRLLSAVITPYLITSVCYNPETNELVTGAIGVVAFWSFQGEESCSLSVGHEVHLASGEFVHALNVEQEGRVLVALCENVIRVFDYLSKAEIRTFQVSQGVSLTCFSANWLQSFLYAGDLAGDVKVWNFDTGSQINQFTAHQSAISSVVSRLSVHTLMTASLDGLLKEWNLTTCELLRRVDIGEPVFQMQFISEQTFFLRTEYTFSIRTLNNFYQLFNRTKSVLKKLVRVQCGPEKARILATTEDGVCRFLSPVTGEMLFVTWPFQFLEKALDYVYDPEREELLATMGTSDIYVLDTSQNPCPTKYILRCTDSLEDKVLCLAYSRLDLGSQTFSFIFSGYKSGRVRSVTQHLYRMGGRKLHDGKVVALSSISASGNLSYHSRESSYLCSYGADEYIILSDVVLKRSSLLELVPLVVIPSANCRINHLLLIPGYICVLTEQNRVRLWRQASLVPGKKNPFWKETDAMHSASITSFDYCYTLNMLVTGGADGSVRIWDILGQLLVEFDTSLKFSRVCFANQRGDLVVGGNKNIYFIPCITYLPSKHLKALSAQCVQDDTVERPLPFLPCFLLSFNIVFVPKYRQVGKQAKKYEGLEPITNCREVLIEKRVAKVADFSGKEAPVLPGPDFYGAAPSIKERHPEFAVEYHLIQQTPFKASVEKKPTPAEPALPRPLRGLPPLADSVPLLRRIPFQAGRVWPIAPDGYIPNSVIRAQLFPRGTPQALTCTLQSTRRALPVRRVVKIQLPEEDDKTERREKARKKKMAKMMKRTSVFEAPHRRDLLAEIVSKPWLRHKPSEMTLPSIMKAILDLMDDVPYSTYLLCTTALVQISEGYQLSPEMQQVAFDRLIQDTDHKEVRMRLAAWEALGKMDLVTEKEVVPLARALLDENKKVRDLARSLLDSVAGITDKFVLKKEMQRLAESSLEDLSQMVQSAEAYFPRRVRAAGIVAETQDEAVYELTEGAQRLMNRVESMLTANLFLATECPPPDTRRIRLPSTRRKHLPSRASTDVGEEPKPEAHGEAQARWLGLFGKAKKPAKVPSVPEGGKPAKYPRTQQSRGKSMTGSLRRSRSRSQSFLMESPTPSSPSSSSRSSPSSSRSPSSSSSSSSSGSTWEELRRARRALRAKAKRHPHLPKGSHSQEARKRTKLPKLAHPALLQRRDTRTQLYSEMLKHQNIRKEKLAAVHVEAESSPVQPKPSQLAPPVLPPVTPKGSFIDPKQQYSLDKTKWRNDLYKLLMLRISPAVEGHTATEDFMASARMALSGPTMSWELFTSISQSLLTSQEKGTQDPAGWKKYMDQLFRPLPPPVRQQLSQEERVAAVQGGPRSSKTVAKVASKGVEPELEDLVWELKDSEEDEGRATGRKSRTAAEGRREEGALSGKERKKMLRRKEKVLGREERMAKEKEQEVPRGGSEEGYLSGGRDSEEALGKERREEAKGKERREVAKGKEREVVKGREREAAAAKGGREGEAAAAMGGREGEAAAAAMRGREGVAARQRERVAAERKSKPAASRKAEELTRRTAGERLGLKGAEQEEEEGAEELGGEWARAWEVALIQEAERVVAKVMRGALLQVRKLRLAEAREAALAEVLEQAKAEAQEISLARVREMALATLKERALAEVRTMALEEAQKTAMAEAREKMLAEARHAVLGEARANARAKAQELVLAEGLEGAQAEARIQALAEVAAMELAEARALQMIQGLDVIVDEGRVLELAAEGLELAEARAVELAEKRVMELAEERIWELVQSKIEVLVKARAKEMTEAKLQELELEEELLRKEESLEGRAEGERLEGRAEGERLEGRAEGERLEGRAEEERLEGRAEEERLEGRAEEERLEGRAEEERLEGRERRVRLFLEEEEEEGVAALWEALEGKGAWPFSEEEREALLSMLEEGEALQEEELDFATQAQQLLDLLSETQKLAEASDTDIQQRLGQVASLLQLSSTMDDKELAQALLQRAQQLLTELEAKQQQDGSERSASVLMGLREALEALQPCWDTADPDTVASRMRALLKTALAVLRAKSLKQRVRRELREKAEKEWKEGEDKVLSKRAWLKKKLRQALGTLQKEQEKAQLETQQLQQKKRRLQFRAHPVLLGAQESWRGADMGAEEGREEEEEVAAAVQRRAHLRALQRQPTLRWSLGSQRKLAWKAIVQMGEAPPEQGHARARKARLPRNSLYLMARPPRQRALRRRLQSGTRHHIFHLDKKTFDWEMFMKLYQSLLALKEEEGGAESKEWQERAAQLLDLYGVSNSLVRSLMQRLLMGDYRQRKYVHSSTVKMAEGQASLGQRILYELVHHTGPVRPQPSTLHGVIPLSYQNNVHPFQPRGTSRYGTTSLKWKTCFKRKLSKLRLHVVPSGDSQKPFVL